jgi:hypothetical protein
MESKHRNKQFKASEFTPTEFSTAEEKAKFANQLVRFVVNGFRRSDFPKWFYVRLSLTFGHIAHYNQEGFWCEYFDSTEGKMQFIRNCHNRTIYGSPEYTFSDVEKALQAWIKQSGIFTELASKVLEEETARELAYKSYLEAKYPSTVGW